MSINFTPDQWVITIMLLVGINAALIGTFMVLRGFAMLTDAMSHALLFGLAVAAILSGSIAAPVMLFGGTVACLLTAYISQFLKEQGRVQDDASIGITFTWLFAMGVILISIFARQIDIDQECVLAGEVALAPFDLIRVPIIGEIPKSINNLSLVLTFNLLLILFGFRYLKALSFDAVQVMMLGLRPALWNFLLLLSVSLTSVASFQAVGVILIISLIVNPAAAAYLITRSLIGMLIVAITFSIISVLAGYFVAVYLDGSISAAAGMMSGAIFLVVWLLSFTTNYFSSFSGETAPSVISK